MSYARGFLSILAGVGALMIGVHVCRGQDRALLTDSTYMTTFRYGCTEIPSIVRLGDLEMKDKPAALAYLEPREALHICAGIDEGTHVAIEQHEYLASGPSPGDYYCVRPYGDPNCYWMHVGQTNFTAHP